MRELRPVTLTARNSEGLDAVSRATWGCDQGQPLPTLTGMTTDSAPQRVHLDSGANRSLGVAYALWLILGILGGHWYYLGRPFRGMLYTFTAGLFMVGWIVDGFRLQGAVRRINTTGRS